MKRHTGLDFADLIVAQYGNDSLSIALETVRQVHIRLSRQTARLREVKADDVDMRQRILDAVCETFCIGEKELRGSGRYARLTHPRRVWWALLRDMLRMSNREIGEICDRDSSTILMALRHESARGPEYSAILKRIGRLALSPDMQLQAGPELELEAG